MNNNEVIINGVKKNTVASLPNSYYDIDDSNVLNEDTIDLTEDLKLLEQTLIINKDEINENS